MKAIPQRIQLSRKKGFNLQKASLKLNSLPAVNCARPGPWGNPQPVTETVTAKEACEIHAEYVHDMLKTGRDWLEPLRGKNLACWCKLDTKHCHVNLLLKEANK
jgi:hypothetical protein